MSNFDGTLSEEQHDYLENHGLSKKNIEKINLFLQKHKEGLTNYVDLVGDDLMPGPLFFHNMEKYGYLLDLDIENASSLEKMKFKAKVTIPIVQKLGKYFLKSPQIFEDRNELLAYSKKKDKQEEGNLNTEKKAD